jgi:hypothetical protein
MDPTRRSARCSIWTAREGNGLELNSTNHAINWAHRAARVVLNAYRGRRNSSRHPDGRAAEPGRSACPIRPYPGMLCILLPIPGPSPECCACLSSPRKRRKIRTQRIQPDSCRVFTYSYFCHFLFLRFLRFLWSFSGLGHHLNGYVNSSVTALARPTTAQQESFNKPAFLFAWFCFAALRLGVRPIRFVPVVVLGRLRSALRPGLGGSEGSRKAARGAAAADQLLRTPTFDFACASLSSATHRRSTWAVW